MNLNKQWKRMGTTALVGLVVMPLAFGPAHAQTVTINGQAMHSAVPPITRNGHTLVAMRSIFEGLGATVQWDGATQTINATGGATTVMMKIGNRMAVVNGQPVQLAQAPLLFRGNTMVPLRFVSEALGATVEFDANTNQIGIATGDNAGATKTGGGAKVTMTPNKKVYVPGEPIALAFTAPPGMNNSAWIGILPSDIERGSEETNTANRIAYQYLYQKTKSTLEFKAPTALGSYDLRAHDGKGNEVGAVEFEVKATTPEVTPTMKTAKKVYVPGEPIALEFTAFPFYSNSTAVDIVPADIPSGDEKINSANRVAYQYVYQKTQGKLEFAAPTKLGAYQFRMNDGHGHEIGQMDFEVKPTTAEVTPTISIDKTNVKAGETIVLTFKAFPFYANTTWVGLLPLDTPRGKEEINQANRLNHQYLYQKTQGTLQFEAPTKAGTYDFRLNDGHGNEIAASPTLTVTE